MLYWYTECPLLMAFFRHTIWLNRSQWEISHTVSQLLWSIAVKHFTTSNRINQLWCNKDYIFWARIWSLRCPACKVHGLYHIVICGFYGFTIFCVFWSSLQLLSKTFLIQRRSEHDIIITVRRSSCKVHVILVRF